MVRNRVWIWVFLGVLLFPAGFSIGAPPVDQTPGISGPEASGNLPFYGGNDLGLGFGTGGVTLKFWCPQSSKVDVIFFDPRDQKKEVDRKSLTQSDNGVWEITLDPARIGTGGGIVNGFYQFETTIGGKTARVLDPYARSMAEFTNGPEDQVGKAALVDPSRAGSVSGYAVIDGFKKRTDAVIYEVHVRDFTSDPGLKTQARFGTYGAFAEKLDHLKSLGVTHVQLLPVQSWYYGDESKSGTREMEYSVKGNNYNWGYDPHGYFSPEGMYSENPADPVLRIKELKKLIEGIHKAGMGVILDVVYNHVARTEIFEPIAPGYFFRKGPDGKFTSNSGCGNDVATTNKMVRKLIVDSVAYWTKEYKVDGFRFDLMGLIDTETISAAFSEASKANPGVFFLGEGWKMYNGPEGTNGADQDWMKATDDVAVFSDSFRDVVKFGGFSEGVPSFLTGKPQPVKNFFQDLIGQPTNFEARSPANVVQYLEAHDGLTLHDTICCALKLDPRKDRKEIFRRIKLGNLILLTSQGIAFLHAGQEMGRTKEWRGPGLPEGENKEGTPFIRNSYDSSDVINRFDWAALQTPDGQELFEYTRGLIKLRRSADAFRLGDRELIGQNVNLIAAGNSGEDVAIGYSCRSSNGKTYFVFVNADRTARSFPLPPEAAGARFIADAMVAGTTPIEKPQGAQVQGSTIKVEPLTGIILEK